MYQWKSLTDDRRRLLDTAIKDYFTLTGDWESRLIEIENKFKIDLYAY